MENKIIEIKEREGNTIIISTKGFLKNISFDKEKRDFSVEWSESVEDAKYYKNKNACLKVIKKLGIEAFIWYPKKERYKKGFSKDETRYWVRYIDSLWVPLKVYSSSMTNDIEELTTLSSEKTWTYKEAIEESIRRNEEMIKKIELKNQELKNVYIGSLSKKYGI